MLDVISLPAQSWQQASCLPMGRPAFLTQHHSSTRAAAATWVQRSSLTEPAGEKLKDRCSWSSRHLSGVPTPWPCASFTSHQDPLPQPCWPLHKQCWQPSFCWHSGAPELRTAAVVELLARADRHCSLVCTLAGAFQVYLEKLLSGKNGLLRVCCTVLLGKYTGAELCCNAFTLHQHHC